MQAQDLGFDQTVGLLRQVAAQMVGSTDLGEALDRLSELVAQLIPGRNWCGISVLRDGEPRLAAHSAGLPTVVEQDQYRRGEGPCLSAMCERDVIVSPDLTTEQRWPGWCRLAVAHGARAVLCYPLDIDAQVTGALNVYHATAPLTRRAHLTTLLIAEHASLLLGTVLERMRHQDQLARLRHEDGCGHTAVVHRAIGIVMAQRGCNADQARAILTDAADALGTELLAVAVKLVSTVAIRNGHQPDLGDLLPPQRQ